jgi:hypothetical protein
MSRKIEITEEMAERIFRELERGEGPGPKNRAQELRAVIDAPVVKRESAGWQRMSQMDGGHWWPLNSDDVEEAISKGWNVREIFTGPGVELAVWNGQMPESNGKSNFTIMLHRKGEHFSEGLTYDRSEYPDRIRYEADRLRYLIGELDEDPCISQYDGDLHSGYKPAHGEQDSTMPKITKLKKECLVVGAPLTDKGLDDLSRRLTRTFGTETYSAGVISLFIVQALRHHYGVDLAFTDNRAILFNGQAFHSVHDYWESCTEEEQAYLDERTLNGFLNLSADEQYAVLSQFDNHTVIGRTEQWEYVCTQISEEAAQAFVDRKGHDYPHGLRYVAQTQDNSPELASVLLGLKAGEMALTPPRDRKPYLTPVKSQQLIRRIHKTLDGNEWDSDTVSDVARHLTRVGYVIREV